MSISFFVLLVPYLVITLWLNHLYTKWVTEDTKDPILTPRVKIICSLAAVGAVALIGIALGWSLALLGVFIA